MFYRKHLQFTNKSCNIRIGKTNVRTVHTMSYISEYKGDYE